MQKLLILIFELLKNVIIVEQLLDAAVWLAEQVFDGWAALLSVVLPEVAVQESMKNQKLDFVRICSNCLVRRDFLPSETNHFAGL